MLDLAQEEAETMRHCSRCFCVCRFLTHTYGSKQYCVVSYRLMDPKGHSEKEWATGRKGIIEFMSKRTAE